MVTSGATRGIPDGRRIVVKIGSKSLVSAADRFEQIAQQVADLRAEQRAVVIVSSGAIALGRQRLGLAKRPTEMAMLQACGKPAFFQTGVLLAGLMELDAMRRRGIEFTQCRHEASAGVAAAVYGKLKGTAGVAVATLGPGASKLLFPVASGLLDREPLLAMIPRTRRTSSNRPAMAR